MASVYRMGQREKAEMLRGKRANALANGKCIKCMNADHLPLLMFCGPCRTEAIEARKGKIMVETVRKCSRCKEPCAANSQRMCERHLAKQREYQARSIARKAGVQVPSSKRKAAVPAKEPMVSRVWPIGAASITAMVVIAVLAMLFKGGL